MVNELLIFHRRPLAIAQCEVAFATHINGNQYHEIVGCAKFNRARPFQ